MSEDVMAGRPLRRARMNSMDRWKGFTDSLDDPYTNTGMLLSELDLMGQLTRRIGNSVWSLVIATNDFDTYQVVLSDEEDIHGTVIGKSLPTIDLAKQYADWVEASILNLPSAAAVGRGMSKYTLSGGLRFLDRNADSIREQALSAD